MNPIFTVTIKGTLSSTGLKTPSSHFLKSLQILTLILLVTSLGWSTLRKAKSWDTLDERTIVLKMM